jgi:hypothetical protein
MRDALPAKARGRIGEAAAVYLTYRNSYYINDQSPSPPLTTAIQNDGTKRGPKLLKILGRGTKKGTK